MGQQEISGGPGPVCGPAVEKPQMCKLLLVFRESHTANSNLFGIVQKISEW